MKFDTRFSCGDTAYVFSGDCVHEVTIGQIRIEYTDSAGVNDGRVEPNCGVRFDNYAPKRSYVEQYMAVETGIGSGSIYTLGQHIFATREECEEANAARIADNKRQQDERRAWEKQQKIAREARLRAELEEIERLKTEEA